MKPGLIAILCLASAGTALPADAPPAAAKPRNRFSLNASATLGVQADFKNLGGFSRQTDPGTAAAGTDHFYDDGFNRVDSSGNAGGLTWFWGYQNASQISGGSLLLNSSTAPADGSLRREGQPLPGFEFSYERVLGEGGSGTWGLKAGLSWTGGRLATCQGFTTDVTVLTDSYALSGVVPPAPSFTGTSAGPGPTISDAPVRSSATVLGGAATTGKWILDADVIALRLGPWFEAPLGPRLRLQAGGGALGAVAHSRFAVQEATTVATLVNPVAGVSSTQSFSGSTRGTDVLGGAYAEASLIWTLAPQTALRAAVARQWTQSQTQQLGARAGRLGLDNLLHLQLALTRSF